MSIGYSHTPLMRPDDGTTSGRGSRPPCPTPGHPLIFFPENTPILFFFFTLPPNLLIPGQIWQCLFKHVALVCILLLLFTLPQGRKQGAVHAPRQGVEWTSCFRGQPTALRLRSATAWHAHSAGALRFSPTRRQFPKTHSCLNTGATPPYLSVSNLTHCV